MSQVSGILSAMLFHKYLITIYIYYNICNVSGVHMTIINKARLMSGRLLM